MGDLAIPASVEVLSSHRGPFTREIPTADAVPITGLVYQDGSALRLAESADADVRRANVLAMAVVAASEGGYPVLLSDGRIEFPTAVLTPLAVYVLSENPGRIKLHDELESTETMVFVGYAETDRILALMLNNTEVRNVAAPVPAAARYYFNPSTGDDAADGKTPETAWKTSAKLAAAIAAGAIVPGGWVDETGAAADISTLADADAKREWFDAYRAGRRFVTGSRILLDTTDAPFQMNDFIQLPHGVEFGSATVGKARIRHNRDLVETWTQPDAGTYPHVWGTAGTVYHHSLVWEGVGDDRIQLCPITAADLATALPLLEAETRGAVYSDPVSGKIYIRAYAGGNPNSDAVVREYSVLTADPGYSSNFIVTGCYVHDLACDGGATYNPTVAPGSGQTDGQYLIGVLNNPGDDYITVVRNCDLSRASKHHMGWVGGNLTTTLTDALLIVDTVTASLCMGGCFFIDNSHFVDYNGQNTSNNGKLVSIYYNCSTPNAVSALGAAGADATARYTPFFTHNAGSGSGQFERRTLVGCSWGGEGYLGDVVTRQLIIEDCPFGGNFVATSPYVRLNRVSSKISLPQLESADLVATDCLFTGEKPTGYVWAGSPRNISGTITLRNTTVDALTLTGVVETVSWTRAAALTLTLDGCVILYQDYGTYGLFYGLHSSDTRTITNTVFQTMPAQAFARNYEGTGGVHTVADETANMTNSPVVSDAWLDPTSYKPFNYSPAIELATDRAGGTDITNTTFAHRNDAGAYEYVNDPLPLWTDASPANLAGYYDKNVNQFSDAAGTTPITGPGDNLKLWKPPTGSFPDLTVNANFPTASVDGGVNDINTKYLIYGAAGTAVPSDTRWTIYVVVRREAAKKVALWFGVADGGYVDNAANQLVFMRPDGFSNTVAFAGPDRGLQLFSLYNIPGALYFRGTGDIPKVAVATNGTGNWNFNSVGYGADANFDGAVLGWYLYNGTALPIDDPAGDRRVRRRIMAKYGVSL